MFDLAINTVRPQLVTVPGAAIPFPYGGKLRQVQVDLDPAAAGHGLSAKDVVNALAAQNLLTPAARRRSAASNTRSSSTTRRPIRGAGRPAGLDRQRRHGLSARRRPGARRQPAPDNIVHVDGGRSVLLQVLKTGSARRSPSSTASRTGRELQQDAARQLSASPSSATSRCSSRARSAASPRGGDRRRADQPDDPAVPRQLALDGHHRDLDPARDPGLDRPAVAAFGETLNIMTLGGLALAVGILVDDATVTIENINCHLEQGKESRRHPGRRARRS